MKRILFFLLVAFAAAPALQAADAVVVAATENWTKSSTQAFAGANNLWYKLDDKAQLWASKDGKSWMKAETDYWTDKQGRWVKIHDKKLQWSTDGKTWSEVPEWKWQGHDGKWYKYDQNWSLWVNG